jgi:hypothetical protein
MARSRADVRDWAIAYIEAQESPRPADLDHPLWWSIERTLVLDTLDKAEDVWALILEVLARTKSPRVIGMLGAGPMEDLLEGWGTQFIERIETTARRDPAFREMLRGVWESGTPDIWARLVSIRDEDCKRGS